jgi:hypothetical protein
VARRPPPTATGAALLLLALAACQVPHRYETKEFSAAGGPGGDGQAGPMEVVVKFGAGAVEMGAGPAGRLYQASLTYCADHNLPSVDLSGRRLAVSLPGKPGGFQGFGGERDRMSLSVSPEIPQIIDLDLGPGDSVVDLSGLRLRRLKVSGGAGDTRIVFGTPNEEAAEDLLVDAAIGDLSIDRLGNANMERATVKGGVGALELDLTGQWRRDGSLHVEGAVGDVILKIPRSPGFRLRLGEPWLAEFSAPGFTRQGDSFYSDGYEAAQRRVQVEVEAGIGKLIVERNE